MTAHALGTGRRRSLSCVLYDIAQILESADGSNDRLRRELELLRLVAPCDESALLEAQPDRQPRILVEPAAPPDHEAELVAGIGGLLADLVSSLTKLIDDIQGLACVASAELHLDLRALEPAHGLKAAIDVLNAEPSPAWLTLEPVTLGPMVSSVLASATEGAPSGDQIGLHLKRDEPAAPMEERGPSRTLDGIRVLLVDDDSDIRDAFQLVLEHYGAVVTAVGSVAAALTAFEGSRPDVLLSDLSMPGESGYDLMRQVAARDPTMPAAALTAFGAIADRESALAVGFRIQLDKPIDVADLVATVAELAGRRGTMPGVREP